MNKKLFFCHHLSLSLHLKQWLFSDVMDVFTTCVKELPKNADKLAKELLKHHPKKPSQQQIERSLFENEIIAHWFTWLSIKPAILDFNLNIPEVSPLVHPDLPQLNNCADLASYLGLMPEELEWLAQLWRSESSNTQALQHYHYHFIEKKKGGYRLIESPKSMIKIAQKRIVDKIIVYMPVHDASHGFRLGRSCVSHAQNHVNKRYVLHFDIENYFQSIQWPQVYSCFKNLSYNKLISQYLSALCTHRCQLTQDKYLKLGHQVSETLLKERHLPQGGVSSPPLSNAIFYKVDTRLAALAKHLGLDYSRYADDMVFSSNTKHAWQKFSALVARICLEEGFSLNHRKTRIVKSQQKQIVTGIVVNNKVNIDGAYFDQLKAILFNCQRYGPASQNRERHGDFRAHLLGRVQYVTTLNENKGNKLLSLFNRIDWS